MRFNYGLEKKKFDERWKKLRAEYIQAGWDEESIQLMYEFDYEEFKRERMFCKHNLHLEKIAVDEEEVKEGRQAQLFKNMDGFLIEIPDNTDESRYGWLEEIEDKELYEILTSLPAESLELITQLAMDELRQVDIAVQSGVSRAAIAKKINRLRKKLKILQKRG